MRIISWTVWAAAIALAATLGWSGPARAGTSLYDMNSLLNEPNPFDQAQAPIPGTVAPSRTSQTPAPATMPEDDFDPSAIQGVEDLDGRDPLEGLNRAIFAFNEFVYKWTLTPAARGYNKVVPEGGRNTISRFFSNLGAPVVFANDLLQGQFTRAGTTAARFVINSTIGMLGFGDPAADMGLAKHSEDFGQTLAVWGLGEGFYLVLPLLGPSNPRDAVGKLFVDNYFDPLGYYLDNTDRSEWSYVRAGMNGFVTYADIVEDMDNLRQTSVDFYGALRSLYRQRRSAEIRNQEEGAVPSLGGLH
jgi:phospholipid-binding lipoprotein MlaA